MNIHPPPLIFLSPLLSFFPYPSNIEIIFDFSDIITKIHSPFQNPGSAPEYERTFYFSRCSTQVEKHPRVLPVEPAEEM